MLYISQPLKCHISRINQSFFFFPTARENKLEAFCQCSVSHAATDSLTFFCLEMAENSASQGSSQGRKEPDPDLGLVEKDGAIGIYKNSIFQPMTNFHIACKGFVSNGGAVEGYLIDIIPAHYQCLGVEANSERYVNSECT